MTTYHKFSDLQKEARAASASAAPAQTEPTFASFAGCAGVPSRPHIPAPAGPNPVRDVHRQTKPVDIIDINISDKRSYESFSSKKHRAAETRASEGTPSQVAKVAKAPTPPKSLKLGPRPFRDNELWIERAATLEIDGGLSRYEAEHAAVADVILDQLDNAARLHLPDMPPRQSKTFIADCRAFLANDGLTTAEALGWTVADLFGADPDKPYARIDRAGLVWLLGGNRVVAMTDTVAVIETRSGARQTYRRRKPAPPTETTTPRGGVSPHHTEHDQ
jgi:hypothetical protein